MGDRTVHSMTGYGKGTCTRNGHQATVEVSSVNSKKQADVRLNLPRELSRLEPALRNLLREHLARGSVSVTIACELSSDLRRARFEIDRGAAASVVAGLRELARSVGISDELRVGELLLVPGIVTEENPSFPAEIDQIVESAMTQALVDLSAMRSTEGQALCADLTARRDRLRELIDGIAKDADVVLAHQAKRLRERIGMLGVDLDLDDDRLAREAAFYAERSDISEELVRLESHLSQFSELLTTTEPAGRALEFLCQEMSREVSTVCAKTCDTRIAQLGLALRAELGRVREQVLNVE